MQPRAEAPAELDLRTYLRVLWRRKLLIAFSALAIGSAAFFTESSKTELYRASSQLLVSRSLAETLFDPLRGYVDPDRALANQIRVIQSPALAERVQERLGYTASISAGASGSEDILMLTAVDTDPRRAAAVANAYAEEYVEYRRTQGIEGTEEAQAELQRRIADIEKQVQDIDLQIIAAPPAQREAVREATSAQRSQLQNNVYSLRQQLDQLQSAANVEGSGLQVLGKASVPLEPFSPTPERNGLQGLLVGLVLGLGLAFLVDYLDDRIRSKEDLERAAGGLTVLGLIPAVSGWRNRKDARLISLEDPTAEASEAYRTLRTSLQFLGLDRPMRTLQMTSPVKAEGKSTTMSNLAVSFARAGQRVIVVDCDLRRPRLHQFFGAHNDVGFTSVLLGDAPLSAALQDVGGEENLRVLASGPLPPNPSELLSSRRTVEVLTALQADADVVLLDSPPVLPVSDSLALSARVDATLVVVSARESRRKQLHRALELLEQVDAPIIGMVLNGVGRESRFGRAYGYGYGYTQYAQDDEVRNRKKRRQPEAVRPN
ncbi:MAG TPA: polysaccharide biosynthesis tyrosine autokinase [Acidimicrobiales bacterium]|jgi:polysaccharide biosynthesis transport protein|nr:polysaccharide biosynthesis tyrosine autokinase [Acidimicrobiales bacterium]